jgi:ABC-2 type transporter
LLRREATVRARDPVTLALTMALPIAVAGLCSLVYHRGCVQPTLLFVFTLTSVWAGVSFTVRDIISNFAVMRHESRTRADLAMSYAAKAVVATGASALQALVLASSLFLVFGAHDASDYSGWSEIVDHTSLMNPFTAFLVLWACHVFGNAVGVVLSASFRTTEAAIFMVPFVVLPLVAFSGALVPPRDLPAKLAGAMRAAPLYQGYVGLLGSSANICFHAPVDVDDPSKSDRSVVCDAEHRTLTPPGETPLRMPFVQSESSCLHNTYQYTGDFCHDNGLPCHPGPSSDPVGRQLNAGLVATSVGTLVGFSGFLYLAALQISKRRMRTLW